MVLGTSNETVKFHGVNSDSWHGIVLDSVKYGRTIMICIIIHVCAYLLLLSGEIKK